MHKYLLAALASAAFATPALAQDGAPFTGPRVEGIVGWDRAQNNGSHDDGIAYGVGVGYDFQAGGAVLGIEGEASDSTAKDCSRDVAAAGDRLCAKAGRDLYVGGRVGAVVALGTLLYAKAGYTNDRANLSYTAAAGGPLASYKAHESLDGVRAGAGVEHMLGRNAYVKAEYRYSNYEKGFDRHQVVGGVGFRF